MEPAPDPAVLVAELERIAPRWRGRARPIDESTVGAFEAEHRIRLPDEYRGLLLAVGDGAPLPTRHGGGLLLLAEARKLFCVEHALGPLAEPFPHAGNEPVSVPWDDDADEYLVERWLPGCLPLAYCGCDESRILVVTGPERGRVWGVTPAGDPELHPTGCSFAEWYAAELKRALDAARSG